MNGAIKNWKKLKPHELNQVLGNMDLFLLDQVLKGRFQPSMRILDAGCGEGRNSHYFLANHYNIYGVDHNPKAIKMARMVARNLNPEKSENFLESHIDDLPFPDQFFEAVLCCSVLHFAKDLQQFQKMVSELNRVLKPEGVLFVRMKEAGNSEDGSVLLYDHSLGNVFRQSGFTLLEPYRSVKDVGQVLNVMVMEKTDQKKKGLKPFSFIFSL